MFRQLREHFAGIHPEPVGLRLLERRTSDGRLENLPTANDYEFAGLVVDNDFTNCRDVVAEHKKRGLQHINVGKRVILPSSFTGGYRYMQQNFQDSLAVCKQYGHPDLFITFTCNPKWDEIQDAVQSSGSHDASVRPDLVARVFKMKLDAMMNDLTKKHVLGRVLAVVYTVEFQKRGLPHAHIVLWLDNRHVVPFHRGLLIKYQAHINGNKVQFREWVLAVGDGLQESIAIGDDPEPLWITLPEEVFIHYSGDPLQAIVKEIYSEIQPMHGDLEYLRNRAILTPLNEHVENVNITVLQMLPGDFKEYKSCDSVCKGSSHSEADEVLYPPEFLNSLKFSGMPNHEIKVKVGAPIMLLRNLNAKKGLCNDLKVDVLTLDMNSPVEQVYSGPMSLASDDCSPEDATLYRLQDIVAKDKPEGETDTNPIDRTVAHLLFHRTIEFSENLKKVESPTSTNLLAMPRGVLAENYNSMEMRYDEALRGLVCAGIKMSKSSSCMNMPEYASNCEELQKEVTEVHPLTNSQRWILPLPFFGELLSARIQV
ncbi:hypothetical protein POM88_045451 [Heracleum sosnowskyi]|uniref:ATP-dependent DNA helicase n=1 Tax=Heracleum sosnowskyi TaxID=360622 RepID=A0AAD8M661_9APIA|nr:hypothetical protein POM88_045451 [Heracleum sosnowskyi]